MQPKIDQLILSKRKTIALQITRDGKVIVRAPQHISKKNIDKFVAQKKKWLTTKLQLIHDQNKQATMIRKNITTNKILFLGKFYPLKIVSSSKTLHSALTFISDEFLLAKEYAHVADHVIILWYKKEALKLITNLVQMLAHKYSVKYKKISISDAKTRWGSCSSNGNIRFSWRLIMTPLAVIEYVVIHEVSHLVHHNHSKAFWNKVESLLPNYVKCKKWLQDNGSLLTLL